MRSIASSEIVAAVRGLCIRANTVLPDDVASAIGAARDSEPWPPAKAQLDILCRNIRLAGEKCSPICQDTGIACVFAYVGQDVHIEGDFEEAINEGVRQGYREGYLRNSVVADPLRRSNTGDNTPAVVTSRLVPGDKLRIALMPKGFGSENMSALAMLDPSAGREGVMDFVTGAIIRAGSNPCPPVIVGVGIGGTFDRVALLAKQALLRPIDSRNPDPYYADMELELLDAVNASGIGPQGFGGRTTALAILVEALPTHIAGLPVAVNMSCHAARHGEVLL